MILIANIAFDFFPPNVWKNRITLCVSKIEKLLAYFLSRVMAFTENWRILDRQKERSSLETDIKIKNTFQPNGLYDI